MDYQTTINEPPPQPARDLRQHVTGVAHDVNRIAELQMRLMAADLQRARATMTRGGICWAAALGFFVALLPVAVAGFGLLLADLTRLTPAGGLLVAAAVAAAIALVLLAIGWAQFRKQRELWRTSVGELQKNLDAIRQALLRAGQQSGGDYS